MITIGKRFTFDSAHKLPLHDGKCQRLHGHTYILEVEISGELCSMPISQNGMVMDYGELKNLVEVAIIDVCDHQFLNEIITPNNTTDNTTTAERLVETFAFWLLKHLDDYHVTLRRVRLQETPNTWAVWEPS